MADKGLSWANINSGQTYSIIHPDTGLVVEEVDTKVTADKLVLQTVWSRNAEFVAGKIRAEKQRKGKKYCDERHGARIRKKYEWSMPRLTDFSKAKANAEVC